MFAGWQMSKRRATSATHMLVAVVPAALDDLTSVALVLLLGGIRKHTHVVVHVKVEQGARLAARLVDDEVVKRIMLSCQLTLGRFELTCGMMRSSCWVNYERNVEPTLMYIKLSIPIPRSSGIWARHLLRKAAMSSPFLHCRVSFQPLHLQYPHQHFCGVHCRPSTSK